MTDKIEPIINFQRELTGLTDLSGKVATYPVATVALAKRFPGGWLSPERPSLLVDADSIKQKSWQPS